jgi:DNA-binding IclR family transcriptional regulator
MAKTAAKEGKLPVLRDVPAVSRAIAILRLLGRSDTPLGVQVIAKTLRLIPSTCLHILRVLVTERLVSVDPSTKQYTLSAGTVALARTALQKQTFARLIQPDLDQLSEAYGVTAIGVEALDPEQMIVVALSRSNSALRIHVDIGSRFPLLISATGRCVAAFSQIGRKEIEKRFRALRWDNPPKLADWHAEVEKTAASGYGVDDGSYITGIAIIAAPIYRPGKAISSIVVVGIGEHLKRVGIDKVGVDLRMRAERLTQHLADSS